MTFPLSLRLAPLTGVAVRRRWPLLVLFGSLCAPVAPMAHASGGRLEVELKVRHPAMSAVYKLYGSPDAFPDAFLAQAVFSNRGGAAVESLSVRFRVDGYADWSTWSSPTTCPPGATRIVPYHPVLDRKVVDLQSATPVDLRFEWRCRGNEGGDQGAGGGRLTLLGGREFVFSSVTGGTGQHAEQFSNAPLLAAWVSRDDPVIKQFAALVSRNAAGAAANLSIEGGLELLRAQYELLLLNDFVYKAPIALQDPRLSFDVKVVQNLKYPRDVLRDKSGTCIELAIFHAAVAYQLGIRPYLAIVPGHCFPMFILEEGSGDARKEKLVAFEANGIRGGMRHLGMDRMGFRLAVETGTANEATHRKQGTLVLVDVVSVWEQGIASPELPALADDALTRWGISEKGVPGISLPDIGSGPALEDPAGLGGTWVGDVKARLGGPELRPHRLTLVAQPLRGGRFKILLTLVPADGGATVQEEAVAEDQEGQLIFQGKSRVRLEAGGRTTSLTPGRGAARVENGRLVGRYGADGEGFSKFSLDRK